MCGATIAPVGDHYHVATGVTEYLTGFGPVWLGNSPLWFMLLVASFMAWLAVFQGYLQAPYDARGSIPRPKLRVMLSPLLVLGLYLTTSFYPAREGGGLELLMVAAAIGMFIVFDRTEIGLAVGIVVALVATGFEIMLVKLGVFRYLPQSDELFGVAPWLLPLYFSASVAVGAVGRRLRNASLRR